jgi:cytoskeletal protein CcmA (bactofilin family)
MLFNKKPQEEFATDFSTTYGEPRPNTLNTMSSDSSLMGSRKSASAPTRSVIDAWLTINGNLESEGEVQVDGKVNGDLRCAHLIVGKDASISGNIIAEEVIVRGKVKGVIRANRVTLQDTSVVESEIFHKSLAIEQGACFEGQSRRREEPMMAEIMAMPSMAADHSKSKANGKERGASVAA